MKYILTSNGDGILALPNTQIISATLPISFEGAPSSAVAVIESEKKSYRNILNGCCEVPASILLGVVKISVIVPDGTAHPRRWSCDSFISERMSDGRTIVYPNYSDALQKTAELRLEIQDLSKKLQESVETLKKLIEDSTGYDTF